MNLALAMALRVQQTLDTLAALKARTADEIEAEERLTSRLADLLGSLLDRIEQGAAARGLPTSEGSAALMLGDITDLVDQVADILEEETGDEVAEAIAEVEDFVAAAMKADRPFGMDRLLHTTMQRLSTSMVERFTGRALDALVTAANDELPVADLRAQLADRLQGELSQLSRHALGDARNEAVETAERELGVTHHRWVTAGDDRVRPAHAEVDGEIVKVGDPFSNGWRRPGGVGCRCRLEPVVIHEAPEPGPDGLPVFSTPPPASALAPDLRD